MNVGEINGRLTAAMALRMPMFDPSEGASAKIGALEDYLRLTAWHRGALEEGLHWAWEALKLLKEGWMDVSGWEAMAGRGATQQQIDAAKRVVAPDAWRGLQDAEILVRSLDRQIKRLAQDDAAASRAYTMLTGS